MNYSLTCTCGQVLSVDAANDDEAKQKMMPVAKEHLASAHPDQTMTDEEVVNMIATQMKPVM